MDKKHRMFSRLNNFFLNYVEHNEIICWKNQILDLLLIFVLYEKNIEKASLLCWIFTRFGEKK